MHQLGGKFLLSGLDTGAKAGHVDIVAHLAQKLRALGEGEGCHAPVNAVGAVALGGVLLGDVGKTAQHLLAGRRLLPRRAVAGAVGIDAGADGGLLKVAAQGTQHVGCLLGHLAPLPGFLHGADGLAPAHVLGHPAGKGKFTQADGVGAVGGRLAGGNELVGGGDGVVNHGAELHQKIVLELRHLRPVLDVGAVAQLGRGIGLAEALVAALFIDRAVEVVGHLLGGELFIVNVGGGGEDAAVSGSRRNGTGVHQGNRGNLAAGGLAALAVGEVPGGMADGEGVVGRSVAGAKARAAEGGLHDAAGLHERGGDAVFGDGQGDGRGGGVDGHVKVAVADAAALQNGRCLADILIHAAGAADDDALLAVHLAVHDIMPEIQLHLAAQLLVAGLFHLGEDLLGVFLNLVDGVGDGGMEGQGDHGLHGTEVNGHDAVVVRALAGGENLEVGGTPNIFIVGADGLVGLPDGGEAGGLGGHHVDADAVVGAQGGDAGADELQHLILHQSLGEGGAHQGNGHVLGSHALSGLAG